jgi:hypothetical protein
MRFFIAGVTALITIGAAGCSNKTTSPSVTTTSDGQSSQAPAGTDAARLGNALVRFVNADPSGKPREMWMDQDRLFTGVAYKAITPYSEVQTKAAKIRVRENHGQDDLTTTRMEFFAGWHYTLVAAPRMDGSSVILEISDNLVQPKPGKAKVRMINATTDVHDLDLYVAGTTEKLQKGVDAAGRTQFSEVAPGTLEIRPLRRPMPSRLSKLVVEPDRFYTFVVVGKTGDLDVVLVEDRLGTEDARR